ncbi:hypothetical protein ACNJ2K_003848 [Escherichia coli]
MFLFAIFIIALVFTFKKTHTNKDEKIRQLPDNYRPGITLQPSYKTISLIPDSCKTRRTPKK